MSATDTDRLIALADAEVIRLQKLVDDKKVDLASIKLDVKIGKVRELAALLNLSVPSSSSNFKGIGRLLVNPANAKVIVNLSDVDFADVAAATGISIDQVRAYVDDVRKKPILPSTVLKFVQGLPVTPVDVIAEIKAAQTLSGSTVQGQKDLGPPPPPPPPGNVTYILEGFPDTSTIIAGPFNALADATAYVNQHLAVLASRGWKLKGSDGVEYAHGDPPQGVGVTGGGPVTYRVTGTNQTGGAFVSQITVTPPDTVEATKARLEGLGFTGLVFAPLG